MNLSQVYQEIKAQAESGARGLRKFTPADWQAIESYLKKDDGEEREKALFVCVHSMNPNRELEATLLKLMTEKLSSRELVWLMNAVRKHIIQARFKDGDRLTHEFLEALRALLFHPDAAVVEWVLRTIEECGAQAIVFRGDLAKIKPSFWSLWSAEKRTLLELVTFIERKWPKSEKS